MRKSYSNWLFFSVPSFPLELNAHVITSGGRAKSLHGHSALLCFRPPHNMNLKYEGSIPLIDSWWFHTLLGNGRTVIVKAVYCTDIDYCQETVVYK